MIDRTFINYLFLVSVLALAGCGADSSAAAAEGRNSEAPKKVRIERAQERPIGESVLVNGTLDAFDRSTVGTKVAGRLSVIAVDLGSRVRRGQMIARVDPTDYQLRVQQSEAGLAQARARLGLSAEGGNDGISPSDTPTVREARAVLEEARAHRVRYAALLESGLISKADFDTVQASTRVAESRYEESVEEIRNRQGLLSQRRAEVALARQQLADTAVYAAFDGVVQSRQASPGEYLAAGAPIAEIVKVDPLRFRAEVPERDANKIRIGQSVRLIIEGAGRDYTGRVTRVAPTITERTRVLSVEADIPNDGALRAGSFARATIVTDASQQAITVPTDSVVTFAGIQKVMLVENGMTAEKAVTTGRRVGDFTEILSGVKTGDEVVVNPVNLRSGQAVTR